jgi:hypothetical protein
MAIYGVRKRDKPLLQEIARSNQQAKGSLKKPSVQKGTYAGKSLKPNYAA